MVMKLISSKTRLKMHTIEAPIQDKVKLQEYKNFKKK